MSDRGRLPGPPARSRVWPVLALTVAVAVLAGLVAACGLRADESTGAAPTPAEPTLAAARPTATPGRVDAPARLAPTSQASPPSPEPLVALAIADASRRTGAAPTDVRIVRTEAREWPDRSLGCPRPGMGYAQAITPGYLIVAEAGGQQLAYHTDHAQVVLCTS